MSLFLILLAIFSEWSHAVHGLLFSLDVSASPLPSALLF